MGLEASAGVYKTDGYLRHAQNYAFHVLQIVQSLNSRWQQEVQQVRQLLCSIEVAKELISDACNSLRDLLACSS
jgi:hypothetical protein